MAKPRINVATSEHYVNNADFSKAVIEYTLAVRKAKSEGADIAKIPNYIGECFMRISRGLSRRPNFAGYSYRDEMMMDGVENCVKAIMNFDPSVATRTGSVNAFSYFTQICYFAFLRRLDREKRQQEIKEALIDASDLSAFATNSDDASDVSRSVVENVRSNRTGADKGPKDSSMYTDWNRGTVKRGSATIKKPTDTDLYSIIEAQDESVLT